VCKFQKSGDLKKPHFIIDTNSKNKLCQTYIIYFNIFFFGRAWFAYFFIKSLLGAVTDTVSHFAGQRHGVPAEDAFFLHYLELQQAPTFLVT
jgi:hypothetical protein